MPSQPDPLPPRAAPDLDAIERAAREYERAEAEVEKTPRRAIRDMSPTELEAFAAQCDERAEAIGAYQHALRDPATVLALVREARDAARLRDIIRPGDAAAYEEGMAALTARAETAEAALVNLIDWCGAAAAALGVSDPVALRRARALLARHKSAPEPARDPGARD